MDPAFAAELIATVDSLGYFPDPQVTTHSTYLLDPAQSIDSLKDLLLYLRRDDDSHNTRRLLNKASLLPNHLIPILKVTSTAAAGEYTEPHFPLLLRLLSSLTLPAIILYDERPPKNPRYLAEYLEIESQLRAHKQAFTDASIWSIFTQSLQKTLSTPWENLREDDKVQLERILILVRNVLMIPADPREEQRVEDEESLHDRVLLALEESGMLKVLLEIAADTYWRREYALHVLEIVMMVCSRGELGAEGVAKEGQGEGGGQGQRSEELKKQDEEALLRVREQERGNRMLREIGGSSRHSRFGGTFQIKGIEGPSGKDVLTNKVIGSIGEISWDKGKKRRKGGGGGGRTTITFNDQHHRSSTRKLRIILHKFLGEGLLSSNLYNELMSEVRRKVERESNCDETYWLWGVRFFLEFNRFYGGGVRVERVKSTLNMSTFHYTQTLLDKYHSMMTTDKDNIALWSKRAHSALQTYKELLLTLLWMDRGGGGALERAKSKEIKTELFYMPEYRELLLSLLNTFESSKLSTAYLKDLIEANHVFLKMLEDWAKVRGGEDGKLEVLVKKKKRVIQKKNPKKKVKNLPKKESQLENLWISVSEKVLEAVESEEKPEEAPIPFDATIDTPIEEQWSGALERIAVFLHTGKFLEAVGLLRAGREVWGGSSSERDEFGKLGVDLDPIDEGFLLKAIFMDRKWHSVANRERKKGVVIEGEERVGVEGDANNEEVAADENKPPEEEEEDGEKEESEKEEQEDEEDKQEEDDEDNSSHQDAAASQSTTQVQQLDFQGFLYKYISTPKPLSNYAKLFSDYEHIPPFTLQCILKMFHRVVFQLDCPALICQASIFRTFQSILRIADFQRERFKETTTFFNHFWPKFLNLTEKVGNKAMVVELLFWKSGREAVEIGEGYKECASASASGKGGKKAKRGNGRIGKGRKKRGRRVSGSDVEDRQQSGKEEEEEQGLELEGEGRRGRFDSSSEEEDDRNEENTEEKKDGKSDAEDEEPKSPSSSNKESPVAKPTRDQDPVDSTSDNDDENENFNPKRRSQKKRVDSSEDEENLDLPSPLPSPPPVKSNVTPSSSAARRRRIIDDDDDEDESPTSSSVPVSPSSHVGKKRGDQEEEEEKEGGNDDDVESKGKEEEETTTTARRISSPSPSPPPSPNPRPKKLRRIVIESSDDED